MIYVDLDNTLVCVRERALAPQACAWTEITVGQTEFLGVARSSVHEFLSALRSISSVHVLTFARRDYALAVCHRLRLGFGADEVISQEDWWRGWLGGPSKREPAPTSTDVLVANASDAMNNEKLGWLGPRARLVEVPDFLGEREAWIWQHCIDTIRGEIFR